ncbi:MAG TPA: tRNA-dihydrouridine synthase, partial [Gammaproteobacteria bacterium]|nr:tRNA-dihydrouridine synthase [Gammaproteobacteria bacterium]
HWTERYDAPCRYEQIQFFVEALNIPVIGNGDISDAESLRQMFLTGCAGVMIGRAGVGQPWLIKKLMAELKGESFIAPSAKEIGEMLLLHTQGLIDLLESERLAIFAARKFAKYYGRLMRDLNIFISEINQCEGFVDFRRVVLSYFK